MSEQNILNTTAASLFSPDYGYGEQLPELRTDFQAQSGNIFSRQQQQLGRIYDLAWSRRDLTTKIAFQQWENQYRNDYFSFSDWELGRYFTVRFDGPLTYSPAGNNNYNIRGRLIELPGRPMFAYPANWARDAVFVEERNSALEDLVKLTGGGWALDTSANDHGGFAYKSAITNDSAEWKYSGYGFRYWAQKGPALGIVEVTCTRVRDGVVVSGPTLVDLYNVGTLASAALLTQTNNALDEYRVKVKVNGTKNGASSAFTIFADAIEVMR